MVAFLVGRDSTEVCVNKVSDIIQKSEVAKVTPNVFLATIIARLPVAIAVKL
jgi:hypothetical protein